METLHLTSPPLVHLCTQERLKQLLADSLDVLESEDTAHLALQVRQQGALFFSDHFSPMSGTPFFFQSSKTVSAQDTPSCNFLEPGFWILTKEG